MEIDTQELEQAIIEVLNRKPQLETLKPLPAVNLCLKEILQAIRDGSPDGKAAVQAILNASVDTWK